MINEECQDTTITEIKRGIRTSEVLEHHPLTHLCRVHKCFSTDNGLREEENSERQVTMAGFHGLGATLHPCPALEPGDLG